MEDDLPLTREDLEQLKMLLGRLTEISKEAGPNHPLTSHAALTLVYVNALLSQSAGDD